MYLPEVMILTLITSFQLLYSITCRTGAKGKSEMSGQVVVTVDCKNSSEDMRFTYKVQFWKTIPLLLCKHVHVYSREKKNKSNMLTSFKHKDTFHIDLRFPV